MLPKSIQTFRCRRSGLAASDNKLEPWESHRRERGSQVRAATWSNLPGRSTGARADPCPRSRGQLAAKESSSRRPDAREASQTPKLGHMDSCFRSKTDFGVMRNKKLTKNQQPQPEKQPNQIWKRRKIETRKSRKIIEMKNAPAPTTNRGRRWLNQ